MSRSEVTRFCLRPRCDRSHDLAVIGALDAAAASSLRWILDDLDSDGVNLDLTACSRVTRDAFEVLVDASRLAEARGGWIRLHQTTA